MPRMGQALVEAFTRRRAERAYAEARPEWHEFYEYCLHHVTGLDETVWTDTASSGSGTVDDHSVDRSRMAELFDVTGSSNRPLDRMECVNLSWLFERLAELCLLQGLDERVVFDESLAHSTVGLLQEMSVEEGARQHFELMPRPDAVVYLKAPTDAILERIWQRKANDQTVLRHRVAERDQLRQQTRRAVRITEMGASTLERRGVDVLSVDATRPVEEYVGEVEEFLRAA